MLWPPPLIDSGSPRSRAALTPATTSVTPRQRTISAGRRSIMAFQTERASSNPGLPGSRSGPRTRPFRSLTTASLRSTCSVGIMMNDSCLGRGASPLGLPYIGLRAKRFGETSPELEERRRALSRAPLRRRASASARSATARPRRSLGGGGPIAWLARVAARIRRPARYQPRPVRDMKLANTNSAVDLPICRPAT